jgi:hypothetical protein
MIAVVWRVTGSCEGCVTARRSHDSRISVKGNLGRRSRTSTHSHTRHFVVTHTDALYGHQAPPGKQISQQPGHSFGSGGCSANEHRLTGVEFLLARLPVTLVIRRNIKAAVSIVIGQESVGRPVFLVLDRRRLPTENTHLRNTEYLQRTTRVAHDYFSKSQSNHFCHRWGCFGWQSATRYSLYH